MKQSDGPLTAGPVSCTVDGEARADEAGDVDVHIEDIVVPVKLDPGEVIGVMGV